MTTQKQILKRILMIVLSAILFYGISEMTMMTALCAQTEDVEINEENFPDAGFQIRSAIGCNRRPAGM